LTKCIKPPNIILEFLKISQKEKGMAKKQKAVATTWFIEPSDAQTNEIIAQEVSEENLHRDKLCKDGEKRNLWECSWDFVKKIIGSAEDMGAQFKVFRKIDEGEISLFTDFQA